jgi:hypothetical protein
MSKKIFGILTIIFLLILSSCMKDGSTIDNEDSSVLNTPLTFGEIYNLTEEVEFSAINIITFGTLEEMMESNYQPELKLLTHEQFNEVYKLIISLECEKQKPKEMIRLEGFTNHSITIGIKEVEDNRGFQIDIGKSYLAVIILSDMDDKYYKHELTEEDYINLKNKLDLIVSKHH